MEDSLYIITYEAQQMNLNCNLIRYQKQHTSITDNKNYLAVGILTKYLFELRSCLTQWGKIIFSIQNKGITNEKQFI